MDSRVGIQRAFQDYQMGVNGFEGAHDWRSEIGKTVSFAQRAPSIPSLVVYEHELTWHLEIQDEVIRCVAT